MTGHLLDRLAAAHASGQTPGVTSICSAHPLVLDEVVRRAAVSDVEVLIEATCNQVNQDGGYTGLTPAAFRDQVSQLAVRHGLADDKVVLGGDHLGPNPWRHLPAAAAMSRAEELVRDYVAAGYSKIHLDTSMGCADDAPGALPPALIAERGAALAVVAELAATEFDIQPRYVIGTEVPVPGGESTGHHGMHVSEPADVDETIDVTRLAFESAGVQGAWERVRAVVAQPGVEFSDEELYTYRPGQAGHLYECLRDLPPMVFEAHSTDYQSRSALRSLVDDHFAILKVGPGLTFAYREALFALAQIESELLGDDSSQVRATLDREMVADPSHWRDFYPQDEARSSLSRRYSRSDRSRYYWPVPEVRAAVDGMLVNLDSVTVPDELISQHLPWLRGAEPPGTAVGFDSAEAVLRSAIGLVLDAYASATQ